MASLFGSYGAQAASAAPGIGKAATDIFAGFGDYSKMAGDYAEAGSYNLAAKYASQEADFVKTSTAIQQFQAQRELSLSLGKTAAETAGAGFAASGSSLDLLRDSAAQGALQRAVLGEQGLITEAGYKEQAQSYQTMANAAVRAAGAANMAATGEFVGAGLQVVGAIAGMPGG